jgi:predicted phage tail protein
MGSSPEGDYTDPKRSYSFSGVQNVSRQGVPVPVVYGEVLIGSIVISAGITTEKVTV